MFDGINFQVAFEALQTRSYLDLEPTPKLIKINEELNVKNVILGLPWQLNLVAIVD